MRLAELAELLRGGGDRPRLRGDSDVVITGVGRDSREVGPGDLFCCVEGKLTDGHDHAPEAVDRGVAALLVERRLSLGVPELEVSDVRTVMGPVADAVYGSPSQRLPVVGVTGTNGKTTVVALVAHLLGTSGDEIGVIGTLTGELTTPDAPELQSRLRDFADRRVAAVVMEVSSHALSLHRVDATRFAVAVFTNLGRDHLDHHGSVEEYFRAKAKLFEPGRTAHGVLNRDDPHGRLLTDTAEIPVTTFSLDDAEDLISGPSGSRFRWRGHPVDLPLIGRFNVRNALAAAETARVLGVPDDAIASGLAGVEQVPGRFERIDLGQPFTVVVDYAHTPDGLTEVLDAARSVADRHVALVFGCGGDRDREKRPEMAKAARAAADRIVVTSDNPRSEAPGAIIRDVMAGFEKRDDVLVDEDRRAAIAVAIDRAEVGDVVVVAGKGHETTQTIGDRVVPFDDRTIVRELLEERGWSGDR